jgi:DNA invertase Pin-like site-specific DNA recombinase
MKALIYTRVSSEVQGESGLGLASQLSKCQAYAQRIDAEVVGVIREVQSGKSVTKRPELVEALRRLKAGEAQALIVAKLDRLSRSVIDLCGLLEQSEREGWSLVLLDLGIDTTTPAGRVQAQVIGAFAEYERRLISQRTKDAMATAKAKGVHCGVRSTLAPEVVSRIVAERIEGKTWQSIADRLNADGVATGRGGSCWRDSSVRAVWRSSEGVKAYESALAVVARGIETLSALG